MQTLLSGTKSYIPKLNSGYIKRFNLIEKLNIGLNKKITLISAPAGFGKTSLLSEWSDSFKKNIIWLSLDKSDNNISFFFSYLIDSINKVKRGFGIYLQSAINSSKDFNSDSVANAFISEIKDFFDSCIIVFDDFHFIDNIAIIYFINSLLNKESNLHIIIATRKTPNLNLSKLRLNNLINEIKSDDLRFTDNEQKEFFYKNVSINISENKIQQINSKIEGWVAGLQFMSSIIKNNINYNFKDYQFIEEYLVEEVFFNQEEYIKDFLIKTSIVKYFNVELCNYLLEINNSDEIIKKIKNDNLFIEFFDNKGEFDWYKYHNIFRYLLNKKFRNLENEQKSKFNLRAIEWFEKNNMIIEALSNCLDNNQLEKYCELLSTISMNMVMKGELENFRNLTKNIPENLIQNYFIISLCLGWVNCLTHNLGSVEKYIDYAENNQNMDFKNSITDKEIHIELLRAYYYTLYFKADITYFNKCIEIILKLKREVKDNVLKSSIERILGGLYVVIEEWDLSINAFLSAKNLGKESNNHIVWFTSSANYALLLIYSGDIEKAKKICDDIIAETEEKIDKSFPLLGYIYYPLGKILYELNNFESAIEILEKSIELAHKIGNKFLQITSLLEIAIIYANEKNLKKSLEYMVNAETLIEENNIYKDIFIEFNLLKLWEIHKRKDNILSFTKSYSEQREISPKINEYKEIMFTRFLIIQNDFKTAQTVLENLISQKEEIYLDGYDNKNTKVKNRFFYLEMLLLMTYIYKKNMNMTKAQNTLKKALIYANEKSYLKTFMNHYKLVSDILDSIIREDNSIINNYIFKIIRKEEQLQTSLLSEREIEILKLLSIGLSNNDIAKKLILAIGTVKKHTNSIYLKLGVINRVSAIEKARELNLI